MEATAKELRFNVKELLDTVSRGEEIVITYRGKPRAKLIPYESPTVEVETDEEDALFGMWADIDRIEDVYQYVRDLRKGRFNAD